MAIMLNRIALVALCLSGTAACNRSVDPRIERLAPAPSGAHKPVFVRVPEKLTSIETAQLDPLGRPLTVSCASCHSQRKADTLPVSTSELDEFHRGLTLTHGSLSCSSCHQPGAGTKLRLANGDVLPMTEVMRLCGQCHGTQMRDYGKGAHGGMTGYWDRTRGPRERNNCVDCHDPHVPKFQPGSPAPAPRDRGTLDGKASVDTRRGGARG